MKRWEYVRVQMDVNGISKLDDTVDKLGREGWELTGVVCSGTFLHLWFKRPLS